MESKKWSVALILSTLFLFSCGDVDDPYSSDLEAIEQPAIYNEFSVFRTDKHIDFVNTNFGNNQTPLLDNTGKAAFWSDVTASRALASVTASCGENVVPSGSGFLIGQDLLMTAEHVIFDGVNCKKNSDDPKIEFQFAVDRKDPNKFIDERPPQNFLLKNRLFAMSMHGSSEMSRYFDKPDEDFGDFDATLDIYEPVIPLTQFFNDPFSDINNDVDAAIFLIKPIEVHGIETDVGVLFDWFELPDKPQEEIDTVTQHDSNGPDYGIRLWGTGVATDPALNIDKIGESIGFHNAPGGFRLDFSDNFNPPNPNQNQNPPPRTTVISGQPSHLRIDQITNNQGILEQDCKGNNVGKHCFTTNIDAVAQMSGGPVYHRPFTNTILFARPFVVGVLQGALVNSSLDWGNTVRKNEGLPNQSNVPSTDLTTATNLSNITVEDPPPNPSNFKFVTTPTQTNCIGQDCDKPQVFAALLDYTCAENSDESEGEAGIIGLIGGPIRSTGELSIEGIESANDITGIGTFGVVCSGYLDRPYTDVWDHMRVIGFIKEGGLNTSFIGGPSKKRAFRLMNYNQFVPMAFTKTPTSTIQRPAPMKLCPADHALSGINFVVELAGNEVTGISGVESIICREVSKPETTRKVFPLHLSGSKAIYNQFIGNPLGGNATTTVECSSPKAIATQIFMHVPDSSVERKFLPITRVMLQCQDVVP